MSDAPLTSHQVEQLVSLRMLLEDSLSRAKGPGKYRRGSAIVSLDAAVERATAMVAVTRGLKVGTNVKLDDLISQVKQHLGPSWNPKVLPDIKHLRRARNASQHEGLEPDREQIPLWASATDAYVTTLIDAEFSIDIHQVVLSDAVKDEKLRDLIRRAENKRSQGDFRSSADLAIEAFSGAFNSWKNLRGRREPHFKPFSREIVDEKVFDYLSRRIDVHGEVFDASVFSADAAESVWFISVMGERGDVLTPEDVDRVISFSFEWVVGFERAAENWIENRRHVAEVAARLKRTEHVAASIYECSNVKIEHGNIVVIFRIQNVPQEEDDYQVWARVLQQYLPERSAEGDWWAVTGAGTVEIRKPLDTAGDFSIELDALAEALNRAHEEIKRLDEMERQREREKRSEQEDFARMISSIRDRLPGWLKDVVYYPSGGMGGDREIVLELSQEVSYLEAPEIESGHTLFARMALRNILAQHEKVSQCYLLGSEHSLGMTPVLDSQEILDVINYADGFIVEALDRKKRREENVAEKLKEVKAGIAAKLARRE